jgi:hypothetical protein
MLSLQDREAMAQYVRQAFISSKTQNELEAYSDNLDDVYTPNFFFSRQYDYSGLYF